MSLRPVGTYGPVGALTTIYAAPWTCVDCKQSNNPDKTSCRRCKAKKPDSADTGETDETKQVDMNHSWREILDPKTQQMYYYNQSTNETSWDRPEVMGPAPYASGWFGRGTSETTDKYEENNAKFLARPARKQKDFVEKGATSR